VTGQPAGLTTADRQEPELGGASPIRDERQPLTIGRPAWLTILLVAARERARGGVDVGVDQPDLRAKLVGLRPKRLDHEGDLAPIR